jgi:hypothetical protein
MMLKHLEKGCIARDDAAAMIGVKQVHGQNSAGDRES